ncbi:MAG TPA: hypothetical protein VOA64_16110 [Candidatus Dormibacteraeota bacterium]|nr:hypothetical protein [Candidatus Dormibacteraeota bacterium]
MKRAVTVTALLVVNLLAGSFYHDMLRPIRFGVAPSIYMGPYNRFQQWYERWNYEWDV